MSTSALYRQHLETLDRHLADALERAGRQGVALDAVLFHAGCERTYHADDRVIAYAEERLRNKLEYTNVVYSLLPRRFTLTQMQHVYEAILGEPLDKRNFRRRVVGLGIVRETGQTVKEGAHRPAMLYEFVSREPMVF